MEEMRRHILLGDFSSFYNRKKEELILRDEDNPTIGPSKRRRKNTSTLGNYEVVRHKDGFHSIRDKASGETMHSVTDPLVESKLLYVDQSDLRLHLSRECGEPLVIWDVGLGAATNAMAAIKEIESLRKDDGASRAALIFSFENDLDSLRLALKSPSLFSHVKHPAPSSIAQKGFWENSAVGISWTLLSGDFAENFEKTPAPDIIYYDMYSLNFDNRLWSAQLFKKIFDHCGEKKARLITYTVSTRIRSALLAAGFFVCYGTGTGPKTETTMAFTSYEDAQTHGNPLGKQWLAKWERSTAKVDAALSEEEKSSINQKVKNHRQFTLSSGALP